MAKEACGIVSTLSRDQVTCINEITRSKYTRSQGGVGRAVRFLVNARKFRILLLALVTIISLYAVKIPTVSSELQSTNISLTFSTDRPLRGEVFKVSGRLSTVEGDVPIPLVTVRLQYHRIGETHLAREVTTATSNPGGVFEDLVNTTYLLRIGTWIVNASFASQLGYQDTFTVDTFTVVVQPELSLYLSTRSVALGKNVKFNGLLFACIPCIHDSITVVFNRPDNTSIKMVLAINAIGGPYPGGYYEGSFSPDTPGRWRIRAVWKGNNVTLPASSSTEGLNVEAPDAVNVMYLYASSLALSVGAIVFALFRHKRLAPRHATR